MLPAGAVLLALWIAALWATGGFAAVGTQPSQAVRVMDGQHTQLLRIDHTGAIPVTCQTAAGVAESCGGSAGGGDAVNVFHQSTIRHVSSVTHVAAADGGLVIRDPLNAGARARVDHTGALVTSATVTVTTDNVNVFHQSTIRHVSSVTHMAAADGGFVIRDPLNAGARARVDHTGALVTSATVTVATDNINVFHQSTIRHISSVVHVAGVVHLGGKIVDSANDAVRVTGVTVFTVMGAIDHIAGSLHLAGSINGARIHIQGLGSPGVTHGGVLSIQGVTGMRPVVADSGQSGSWTIQAAHQGGEWNIRHVTSVLHVSIIQGGTTGANHLLVAPVYQAGPWNMSAAQSGSFTVQAAHQGGQWNIAHIGSVTHVAAADGGFVIRDPINAGARARVDHTGALVTSATVTVTTDNVNVFHQSTLRHISSVTHIGGFIGIRDGLCATCWARVDHTGALVTSASVTTTVDNINVFHQSTIRHVSSMTHVVIVDWQRWAHIQASQSGTWTVQAAHLAGVPSVSQGSTWAVLAHAQQSGTWTVQAAHQGGNWAIGHISSVTHVSGLVSVRDDNCLTCRMRIDHYNVLVVQPHISGALRTWQVSQCGTTARTAINTNTNRRDLWVMNRGNGNIYIGYGATGHVALTTANGWPLHATASAVTTTARHSTALSTVYLQNYQGPLACISDLAGQTLQVMEILR